MYTDLAAQGLTRIYTDLAVQGLTRIYTDLAVEGLTHIYTDLAAQGLTRIYTDLAAQGCAVNRYLWMGIDQVIVTIPSGFNPLTAKLFYWNFYPLDAFYNSII